MTMHKQRGMTMIGWLVLLALIGFLTLVGLRLIPGYIEFYTIMSSVESVHAEATPETTPQEIRQSLAKRFQVNDVETVDARDLVIVREEGELIIQVQYEFRTPMMGNVEAVIVFDRTVGG